jgi:hypothetical protein
MTNLKNLLMILLVSSMIVNSVVIADDAVVLNKGQPAPYTGLLLTEEKANSVYNDLNKYKLLNESLQRTVFLYEQNEKLQEKRVNVLLEQNDKLAINLQQARTVSNWEKVLWFGLGFLSVGLGIYGVQAITK